MGKSTPVMGLDDEPMWDSMQRGQLELMATRGTGRFRYPPAPICPETLSVQADWKPLSGKGVIVSWVIFHKQYFEDFPPSYIPAVV
ncbi:MAG TPA: hypothetical protein VL147_02475 [Devosia sp.]|nr:hypothetical protein [Devosia sp.]